MGSGEWSSGVCSADLFTATTGDALVVRMGKTIPTNTLSPEVRLYAPNGTLLGNISYATAAAVTATATGSGTYLVVASDLSAGYSGSGGYRLTLAKTGDPAVIAAGEEDGPLTNGFMHTGTIEIGSLD